MRFSLGGLRIDVEHDDAAGAVALAERLGRFAAAPGEQGLPADAILRARAVDGPAEAGDNTVRATRLRGEAPGELGCRLDRGDFQLTLRRAGGRWSGDALAARASAGALESCVRLLLAAALLDHGRLLVHAAGVAFAGASGDPRGAVLFGASGAGKSTFAFLARTAGERLLGDDLVVVGAHPAGAPHAWGTPFSGDAEPPGEPLSVPLAGLFALRHGTEDALERLPSHELLRRLLPRVLSYRTDTEAGEALLASAEALAGAVPGWALAFRPTAAAVESVAARCRRDAPLNTDGPPCNEEW